MTKLRIAILGSSNHPICEPFAGGMESHIWQLAHELTDRGHIVSLFAAPGSSVDVAGPNLELRTLDLTPISRADPTTPAALVRDHHAYLSVMLDLAGPLADSFDIIHNHSLHYLPIAMSRSVSIPMLTTLHTPPFAWLESAIDIASSAGSSFAAVSEFAAAQWSGVTEQVDVVFNGVSLDRWPEGPGGEYAVWSGRITPEKGPHLAIEAARAAGLEINLAGPVSDASYFAEMVEPLLGQGVTYVGHLGQAQLAELVGAARVALVTPVWDEPYGLVVAEALACGTPVAAFARGGIPEIIDETCGRLARPDDAKSLTEAVIGASTLPRSAARHRAETTCSDQRMIDRYLELYEQMSPVPRGVMAGAR